MYEHESHHELHHVSKLLTTLPPRLGGEGLSENNRWGGMGLLDRIFFGTMLMH